MNLVSRYGGGRIEINGRTLSAPCIIAPGFLHSEWITGPDSLAEETLALLWPLAPRVVLLGAAAAGTAARALRPVLAARHIALETMDLGAACRTYNVLAQEDRAVAALLFP